MGGRAAGSKTCPPAVVEEAGRVFADYLGEMLFVGATKPWGQSIAAFCAQDGGGQPEATIIAIGEEDARLACRAGQRHHGARVRVRRLRGRQPGLSVRRDRSAGPGRVAQQPGKDLALAIVIGYEVQGASRGRRCQPGSASPAPASTCPPSTARSGRAAGGARVLGLSPQHTNYALGLAAAFTGGTFQGHEEGAWQRSLNGGMASERGVTAALLAETGFRATELGLEGVQGFAQMYSDGRLDAEALLDGLGESFIIPDRWVKAYPMNLTLHAPVEALLKIMRDHDLRHRHRGDRCRRGRRWSRSSPSTRSRLS